MNELIRIETEIGELKLELAKRIILRNFEDGMFGLFDTENTVGDPMETLYDEQGLRIDICKGYGYFEVFGLDEDQFEELEYCYKTLVKLFR